MIRRAAAVAIALCLTPVLVIAQNAVFTVRLDSADVYKGPSTGSPIIGHAARGASLPVTRELGSWVKVSWPEAPDGVGYLHVSTGTVRGGAPLDSIRAAAGARVTETAQASSESTAAAGSTSASTRAIASPRPVYVTPATHVLGLGGRFGTSTTLGPAATARAWRNQYGAQIDVSRNAFEPSFIYALPSRLSDSFWLRPYVGTGLAVDHQFAAATMTGFQAFGGAELTFAGAPQLAVSTGLGYRRFRNPPEGFDRDGLGVSVSAHWYVK